VYKSVGQQRKLIAAGRLHDGRLAFTVYNWKASSSFPMTSYDLGPKNPPP